MPLFHYRKSVPVISFAWRWVGLVKWLIEKLAHELSKVLNITENHVIGYPMLLEKPAVKFYRTVQRQPEAINIPDI